MPRPWKWLLAPACALVLVPVVGASRAPVTTPDEQFVAQLKASSASLRTAATQIRARPALDPLATAKAALAQASTALRRASKASGATVGGRQVPEVVAGLGAAAAAIRQAMGAIKRGQVGPARTSISQASAAESSALRAFGTPLRKDFASFAIFRDTSRIAGLEDRPLSVNATADATVTKIVIGIADRVTATAGEGSPSPGREPSIAITDLTIYSVQDPTGGFDSGWCKIVKGLIVCDPLQPKMTSEDKFAVAFGPQVPEGTTFLIKFWSSSGKRSFAVFTTR